MNIKLEKQPIHIEDCYIREMQLTDADHYLALLNHPKVKPVIPEDFCPKSLFDSLRMIRKLKALYPSGSGAYWAVCNPENKLIGSGGFESWDQFHRRLEIAFELHPDYQGRGIMTHALMTMIQFGFKELNATRIEAFTLTDNKSSIKLLERLGFSHEAELRKYRFFNGKMHNIHLFSLINDSH